MACPEGLEPPTCCLEGSCSIQLSYGQAGRVPNKVIVGQQLQGQKRPTRWAFLFSRHGRSGGIRTRDPLLPKQMRYQAALRSDKPQSIPCAQAHVGVQVGANSGALYPTRRVRAAQDRSGGTAGWRPMPHNAAQGGCSRRFAPTAKPPAVAPSGCGVQRWWVFVGSCAVDV